MIPPHDPAAERAALAATCLMPELAGDVLALPPDAFYLGPHKAIFQALTRLHARGAGIDEVTLLAELDGHEPTRDLARAIVHGDGCDAPTRAPEYARIVQDQHRRRQLQDQCSAGLHALSQGRDTAEVEAMLTVKAAPRATAYLTPTSLLARDTEHDPDCLLGRRWLCRGGSALLIGSTGAGKSSLALQAAILWALGRDMFGLTPARPLKSLLIQAENDAGDLAEMVKGVVNGLNLGTDAGQLDERLVCVSDATHAGPAFHGWARALLEEHRPDLCIVDPLFAYLGGAVNDQSIVSPWLRNGLGPLSQQTGCAWLVVHHTNKPPADPTLRAAMRRGDLSYAGAGSAELANWARAVLNLTGERATAQFELTASKRGQRAGLTTSAGAPAPQDEVFLKHARGSICWVRDADREQEADNETRDEVDVVVSALEVGRLYHPGELQKTAAKATGRQPRSLFGREGRRLLDRVKSHGEWVGKQWRFLGVRDGLSTPVNASQR